MTTTYYFAVFYILFSLVCNVHSDCKLPKVLQGGWFSVENGQNTITAFSETGMERAKVDKFTCIDIKKEHNVNYTVLFKNQSCYTCAKIFVRTVNVIEKIESKCLNIAEEEGSINSVCKNLDHNYKLITLFYIDHYSRGRVNCKHSLEGVWNFAYERPKQFPGKCENRDSIIKSCQIPDTLSLRVNEKIDIIYKKCEGQPSTSTRTVEYGCLGDWYVGKNHYFAVFNTRETRHEEKYRCFIRHDEDASIIGLSDTSECSNLKSPKKSPEVLHVRPVKSTPINPGCRLPQNFSGEWIDSINIDADISINETHIVETQSIDGKLKKTVYICRELRLNKAVMVQSTVEGCPNDYVCFDFLRKEKNLIRYRKGKPTIHHQFDRACSPPLFNNDKNMIYDYYLKKNPEPVTCPFLGKYKFTQKGDVPFETRNPESSIGSSNSDVICKEKVSDILVSETLGNEISITKNYCLLADHPDRQITEHKSKPDYKFKCIANWEENEKFYLLTYEEFDAVYQHRCWVYEKTEATKILLSQAIGSSCDPHQNVNSWNYTEGATVALKLQKYQPDVKQLN